MHVLIEAWNLAYLRKDRIKYDLIEGHVGNFSEGSSRAGVCHRIQPLSTFS